MVEITTHQAATLSSIKQAGLDNHAVQATQDFVEARTDIAQHQPTPEKVAQLLSSGQNQLRASADALTLSRQQPFDAFNQTGESRTNVWWQAQFSMAEAALRNDQPTPMQREALQTVLKMVIRLTEADSEKTVADFQDNLLIEFGMRFLSELATPQIETGEQKKRIVQIFKKIRSVFTSFSYALERTKLDLDHLKQERTRLIANAQKMLDLLDNKLPITQ